MSDPAGSRGTGGVLRSLSAMLCTGFARPKVLFRAHPAAAIRSRTQLRTDTHLIYIKRIRILLLLFEAGWSVISPRVSTKKI
jgi:hypothetical protein